MSNSLLHVGLIASTALFFTAGCIKPEASLTPSLRLTGATYAENIEITRQALAL